MNIWRSMLRRFRDDRGQSLVIVALAFVVLCGMVGLTFDIGNGYMQKQNLQAAADAGALAGAQYLANANSTTATCQNGSAFQTSSNSQTEACAEATANNIATSNVNNASYKITASDTTSKVTVTATSKVSTFFVRIFGINSIKVSATATAEASPAKSGNGVVPIGITQCDLQYGTLLTLTGMDNGNNGNSGNNGNGNSNTTSSTNTVSMTAGTSPQFFTIDANGTPNGGNSSKNTTNSTSNNTGNSTSGGTSSGSSSGSTSSTTCISGPGNFGYLDFGSKSYPNVKGNGANDLATFLKWGSGFPVSIGDQIYTKTGVDQGKVYDAIQKDSDSRTSTSRNTSAVCDSWQTATSSCARVVEVPVVNTLDVNGGSSPVTVIGFAEFYIEGYDPSTKQIQGYFIKTISPGSGDPNLTNNYGASVVQLTR